MKRDSILFGYVFPLTRQGFRAFVKTLICLFIPIVGMGAPACSYRSRTKGASAIRVIWLMFRLFLPGVILFLLCNEALYREVSLALGYALMTLMTLSLISSFVRMPMALAALAAGESMRSALSRGHIKRLIESSFARYLLLLLGALPFAAGIALCGRLTAWLSVVCATSLTAWLWMYIGYGSGVCYDQATQIRPNQPGKRAGKGRARRAVAAMMIAVLLCPLLLSRATALAEPMDGASFAEKIKETFSFTDGRIPILSTAWESISDGFSRAASGMKSGYDAAMKRLGFLADVTPVISNVNDLAEAHQYNQQWVDPTLSDEQREKARNLMILKGVEGLLPAKGALKWIGHFMTGADISVEQFYGGWEKAYDEWFGGVRNADDHRAQPLENVDLQGLYQGYAARTASDGVTAYFYVTGSGRSLTVYPCKANGDYETFYRVPVSYDDASGAYYGKTIIASGSLSVVCEYTVRFTMDERGLLLSAQCHESRADDSTAISSYRFTDGRRIGAGSGKAISHEDDDPESDVSNTDNRGGVPVGSFNY